MGRRRQVVGGRDPAPVRTEGQEPQTRNAPPPLGLTRRQIVDDDFPVLMGDSDPAAVRAEPGRRPRRASGVVDCDGAPFQVPDGHSIIRVMVRHQVAAVGAEPEDQGLPIAPRVEAVDFLIVGDAANLDRPVPEPERIAGHRAVEGDRDDTGGPADLPAARFGPQVGQRQAGDCLIAERVEPLGGQLEIAGDRRGAIEGAQAFEPLSRTPAVPSGSSLVHE